MARSSKRVLAVNSSQREVTAGDLAWLIRDLDPATQIEVDVSIIPGDRGQLDSHTIKLTVNREE